MQKERELRLSNLISWLGFSTGFVVLILIGTIFLSYSLSQLIDKRSPSDFGLKLEDVHVITPLDIIDSRTLQSHQARTGDFFYQGKIYHRESSALRSLQSFARESKEWLEVLYENHILWVIPISLILNYILIGKIRLFPWREY